MRADGLAEQFEGASSEASPVAVPDTPPVESQTIVERLAISRPTAKLSITRFRMLPWAAF
jgi:hypothetical protein